ncbi:SMI1/KNR4 family protein [Anatilimnocola sp. NA78]|uniref:SMI1/KNR4 family protein n=1 Tax=Anatilimnocola sp. NA78 TaxID=3415683 RepID=UPI003CE5352A
MGKQLKLKHKGPSLAPGDLQAFEREMGGQLPADYQAFLLAKNGGVAEPCLEMDWNGHIHKIPAFLKLLPLPDEGIRMVLKDLRELGVEGLLPFLSTLNGENICLSFRNDPGTVWFAYNLRDNQVRVAVKLVRLASSFTEFLGLLREVEEPHCRVEELGEYGSEQDLDAYLAEGNSLDEIGKHGFTILGEAIKHRNSELLDACLARGASLVNAVHLAAANGNLEYVRRLVKAGGDVNERDRYGDRPLSYVGGTALPGEEGRVNRAMVNLLVSLGAKK